MFLAFVLAAALAPPPPFPPVKAQSFESEFVAPGVQRADYRMMTANGPLSIEVVAVNLHEPTVRLGTVLASDRLISAGETVSSMAVRTRAIAGINADYFDIGQTNQPLGIVVKDDVLIRTPSRRVALDVGREGTVRFETFSFSGTVRNGTTSFPLTAVNEFPPQGGASLLTAAFGSIASVPRDVVFIALAALGPLASIAGDYRVVAVYDATPGPLGAPTLALGSSALANGPPPAVGDIVTIAARTEPPLETLASAVGGGPLLVSGGKPYDDPNAPAPEERNRRFPVSGAAITPDGTLLLIAVDGRQPSLSIGLTRPEFGALMRGLGASDGMAFDSGGSATLVARVLGEAQARVINTPSDGVERPVADGLFVYSDAPLGPAARLVLHPSHIVALRGAKVAVSGAITDAAGHLLGPAPGMTVNAVRSETLVARAGGLRAELPVTVVDRVAQLTIEPERPNPNPNGIVQLTAHAADPSGRPIALGDVGWSANRGSFLEPGLYRATAGDGIVTASTAGMAAQVVVRVGRHVVQLPFPDGGVALPYDFTGNGRIAATNGRYALPGEPLTFSIEIEGDGSGVGIRAAFLNRFGERNAITLAKSVDWRGWQRRTIAIPGALNPPITLISLYAVNSLGTPPVRSAGTLRFRAPSVVLAGTGS